MPVVFVLFRGMFEKSLTWATKWYGSTRARKSEPEEHILQTEDFDPYLELHDGQDLSVVPKATLTGPKTFVRNIGRTKPAQARTGISVSDEVMLTYATVDDHYHDQLRQGATVHQPCHNHQSQVMVGK